MKPQTTTVLTVSAAVAALGLGYLVYFDYKRRSDPHFRKNLKRERRKAVKATQAQEEEQKKNQVQLIEDVIVATAQETFPSSPEEREKYFMTQVAAGEALCGQGEAKYDEAVLPFYKALKVYPAPMELLMIYQKTIPEPVFKLVVNILQIEQEAVGQAQAQAGEGSAAAAAAEQLSQPEPEEVE